MRTGIIPYVQSWKNILRRADLRDYGVVLYCAGDLLHRAQRTTTETSRHFRSYSMKEC